MRKILIPIVAALAAWLGSCALVGASTLSFASSASTPLVVGTDLVGKPMPMLLAGDPNGVPADSPANRVDPNEADSPFAGVGSFFIQIGGINYLGSGTLVSPTHVLTAAHLFDIDNNGVIDVANPGDVSFVLNAGGSPSHVLSASAIHIHPDFTGFGNPSINDDLAIVTLSSPVVGVPYYALNQTALEFVTPILLVGYGQSGDGINGLTTPIDNTMFTTKRVGLNQIEQVFLDDENPQSGVAEVYMYDFDGPTSATNLFGDDFEPFFLTLGNDLETTLGPGDSGGPSFILVNGEWVIVGVHTFGAAGQKGQQVFPAPLFGSVGGGILIDPYVAWIDSIVNPHEVPEPSSLALAAIGLLAATAFATTGFRRHRPLTFRG